MLLFNFFAQGYPRSIAGLFDLNLLLQINPEGMKYFQLRVKPSAILRKKETVPIVGIGFILSYIRIIHDIIIKNIG